jgi:peptidoglycan hydrolase-like protein with peptidoglycan-binding domain
LRFVVLGILTSAVATMVAALVLPAGLALAAHNETTGPAGPSASTRLGERTLRQGMRGDDVRELQLNLVELGFRGSADGVYGARTTANVKRFERADRRMVDGVVDASDAARIQAVVAENGTGGTAAAPEPPDQAAPSESAAAPTTSRAKAKLGPDGLAVAPADAPDPVKQIITAGNQIAKTPYRYGGGHNESFKDTAYDCSGSVSYALHGADLLDSPLPSGDFMDWALPGAGQWVTVYANEGHMYMVVAGLRFDTSGARQTGSRWQTATRETDGYSVRHPQGL